MRILLANTGHPATIKGGAEAAAFDLAMALVGRGHEVSLVVHHGGREVEETTDRGVRVFALPNRNLYFGFDGRQRPSPLRLAWHGLDSANPWMARAFGRILDSVRPDVVNTHVLVGLSQLVWREAAQRGLPIVHYLHEYGTMCPRGSAFRDGRLCTSPCTACGLITAPRKRLSGLVDTVVGVSRFTLKRHLDWGFFPNARTTVLPNIFVGLRAHPRPAVPGGGPLRIGYFGRLIADKGPQLLIEAVRQLPAGSWTLTIAGTGEQEFLATLKARAPDATHFIGWARPGDIFPHIDLLVVPSIWPDPQPRTVFESFMYGVPVIGARAGGIPEEIDEGQTGWLFEAGSADDLARVLGARVADRADRALDPQNFRDRLALLDPQRVIEAYECVYAEAIADSRRTSAAAGSGMEPRSVA
jgi:glycosyltransferase involved in cell wall biosynthesis